MVDQSILYDELSVLNNVRPLHEVENIFLEVLVHDFELNREGKGIKLKIEFNDNSQTIWTRQAKYLIPKLIPDFSVNAPKYQEQLDKFIVEGAGFSFPPKADFPFRYASGGALPIISMGDKEYYCLFYHEAFPVGWTIANGGCHTVNELLSPIDAIERELHHELIVLDSDKKNICVLRADNELKSSGDPEFHFALKFWQRKLLGFDINKFSECTIPLKWISGPDKLEIIYNKGIQGQIATTIKDCFININAEDYGIEIDKVAIIKLPEKAILCDGEISRDRLFNRPIGLFEVENFNSKLNGDKQNFYPDIFFFDAVRYEKNNHNIERIMEAFIAQVTAIRGPKQMEAYESAKNNNTQFNLCPVTGRIMKRYMSLQSAQPIEPLPQLEHQQTYDVFISFSKDDLKIAQKVYDFLRNKETKIEPYKGVFFSREIYDSDYIKAVMKALDSAKSLVVVGSSEQSITRNWPDFEYASFFLDLMSGKKKPPRGIVSFISFDEYNLPRILQPRQAVRFDKIPFENALEALYSHVINQCSGA